MFAYFSVTWPGRLGSLFQKKIILAPSSCLCTRQEASRGEYVSRTKVVECKVISLNCIRWPVSLPWLLLITDRGVQRIVATDNKSESCLVAYKLCHFQFSFVSKLKYKAFLMNVAKRPGLQTRLWRQNQSQTVLVRHKPSTPTQRRPHVDTTGRLSGDMLVKIVKSEHSKGTHPSRQCRVCTVHKKWL
jgi:hypothetical protein